MTRLTTHLIASLAAACVVVLQGCALRDSTSAYIASYRRDTPVVQPPRASAPLPSADRVASRPPVTEAPRAEVPDDVRTASGRSIRCLMDAVVLADSRAAPPQESGRTTVVAASSGRRPIYHHMASTYVPTYGVNSSSSSGSSFSGPGRPAPRRVAKPPRGSINYGYAPRGTNALTNRWRGRYSPRYYRRYTVRSGSDTSFRVYYTNGGATIRTYTSTRR